MDYEKKYKETLDRAKKWYNAPNIDKIPTYGNRIIEEIFPELIEPEDEEVRKAMIDFFKHEREEGVVVSHYGVNIERMIAWLEKQGQVNETIISQHENKICKENNDSLTSEDARIKKYLLSMFSDPNDSWDGISAREIIAWLEKQGQTFTKKGVDDAYLAGVRDAKQELEKQGEQKPADKVEPKDYNSIDPHFGKPADKVEPKFQNGQWIVWQDKCYKVNYNGCGYELVDQNGLNTSLEYGTVDESAHVWDITKDAKDGDVLADNVGVILFKSIGDNNVINYYAYFSGLFAVQEGEHYWGHVRECTLSPATKEQRERFFAAMHDAGYEWDAEKKKLKKIEDEIEIPFGAKDSELQEATYFIPQGFHAEIDDDKVVIKKGEKPTAWSEEDRKRIKNILSVLDAQVCWDGATGKKGNPYQKEIDWLKSLRPQEQWKPSEEQMEALDFAANCIVPAEFCVKRKVLKELLEQLKKL